MASETSAARPANLSARMDAMFRQDRAWAWGFVIALWLVLALVLFEALPFMTGDVAIAAWVSAIVLGVFNTASIAAMVRHYGHDKEHIYGVDIRHLDAGR